MNSRLALRFPRTLRVACAVALLSLAGCGAPDEGPEQQECRDCDDLTSSRDLPMCAVGEDCEPEADPVGACTDPIACPEWCAHEASAPCLVEMFADYTRKSYCRASGADPCAVVLQYYVRTDGTCFGLEQVAGESIPTCTGYGSQDV